MDSFNRKLIWLVLIIGILTNKGYCKPSAEADKIDDDDYVKDEDDYPNDDDEDDSNDEGFDGDGPPPAILTKSMTITVKDGDDIYLPCDVINTKQVGYQWLRNGTVLFVEDVKGVKDVRISRFSNNTLVIRHALINDSNAYTCQIASTPPIEIVHTVNVISPPKIVEVIPHVPPNKSKIIKKGDSLTLACKAIGHPIPTITWTRRGHKHFPNGHEKMEGSSITFEEVNRKYSGIYECEAKNDYGSRKESVEIHVHYLPEVEIEEETVTTAIGYQPEITCTVHAEPKAEVFWYKDGQSIMSKPGLSMTVTNNKHTLQIINMNVSDFGRYTCHARNSEGTSQKTIYLSKKPAKPKMRINLSSDGKSPEISWAVESYSPILEYELRYKPIDEKEWIKTSPTVTQAAEANIYTGREVLSDLSAKKHLIQVRARNQHDWSPYSNEEAFSGETAAGSTGGVEDLRPSTFLQLLIVFTITKIFI